LKQNPLLSAATKMRIAGAYDWRLHC